MSADPRLQLLSRAGLLTPSVEGPIPDDAGQPTDREARTGPAWQLDFFQLVRIIERVFADRTPVGQPDGHWRDEPVQFRHFLTVEAPTAAVPQLTAPVPEIDPARLHAYVTMMGLLRPAGVLPPYLAGLAYRDALVARRKGLVFLPEQTADCLPGKLADFLDIFTHRVVSLYYRAWVRARPLVAFEHEWWRQQGAGRTAPKPPDEMSQAAAALVGLPATVGARAGGDWLRSLYTVGAQILRRPRPQHVIQHVLRSAFGVPVTVVPLQGPVVPAVDAVRWRLGKHRTTLRRRGIAGVDDRAGFRSAVWYPQDQITLELGPLTWPAYRTFLPARDAQDPAIGSSFEKLSRLARFLSGEHIAVNVRPILATAGVPPLRLGSAEPGVRLGWSTWLGATPTDAPPRAPLFMADRRLPPRSTSAPTAPRMPL